LPRILANLFLTPVDSLIFSVIHFGRVIAESGPAGIPLRGLGLADYTAIYAVGNSLAQFLGNSFPPALRSQYPNVKFQLVSSSQIAEEDTTNLDQIVSIFLHRVTLDENFRTGMRLPDEPNKKPALFLDLHYLITYWGTDPQAEQTILGWTMMTLQNTPILDNSILTPANIWDTTESIQLVPADLSLEDILRIWDALGPKYRLSVSYIARVVRIDTTTVPGPLVVATRFNLAETGAAL
jgi:Pvc16 N-terminal domain